MEGYRAVTAASKPPVLPLSAQMRVAAEMAAPEIRGLAEMIGTEWQAEALRLEGAVEAERERIAEYVRGRGTDCWDPSVEATLGQVAHEIERGHHQGGR